MFNKIKQLFCRHTPSKTRLVTVGRSYESKQVRVPAKDSHCTKCYKVF